MFHESRTMKQNGRLSRERERDDDEDKETVEEKV